METINALQNLLCILSVFLYSFSRKMYKHHLNKRNLLDKQKDVYFELSLLFLALSCFKLATFAKLLQFDC